MRAQSWIQAGGRCESRAEAAARRGEAARVNTRALHSPSRVSEPSYPLSSDDLPRWADVVAAVIISSRPGGVKVTGMGQSSEPYAIGDRKLAAMPGLASAAQQALAEAGIAAKDCDVVEVDGLTLFDEAVALEATGFADKGAGLTVLARDRRVNPSGGSAAGYCAPAMGLARIVEATLQLQRRAGANQLPVAHRAIATGSSIVAAQTHTVIVLEAA
jgi:acetyl-CoA acetyltransferase